MVFPEVVSELPIEFFIFKIFCLKRVVLDGL